MRRILTAFILTVISPTILAKLPSTTNKAFSSNEKTLQEKNLISLLEENTLNDDLLKKIIAQNAIFFAKKVPNSSQQCMLDSMNINSFKYFHHQVFEKYLTTLSNRKRNDLIILLSPLTGEKSFNNISKYFTAQKSYRYLEDIENYHPNISKLLFAPEYKEVRDILMIASTNNNKIDNNSVLMFIFLYAKYTANKCGTDLQK